MIWADVSGKRLEASPKARGTCPCCKGVVIAKCGQLVSWHWAHTVKDCDSWSEPESDWHIGWKSLFPKHCQEVTIGDHRADVQTNRGVIEFQKSYLSVEEIQAREKHYGNMVWVIDGEAFQLITFTDWHYIDLPCPRKPFSVPRGVLGERILEQHKTELRTWRMELSRRCKIHPHYEWLWCRHRWAEATKPVFIDTGSDALLLIKRFVRRKRSPTVIKCKAILKQDFVSYFTSA